MTNRCDYCGGRWDRPGLHDCDDPKHPAALLSQAIVADIEKELHGRKGVGWEGVDEDVADEIRDTLATIIDRYMVGRLK